MSLESGYTARLTVYTPTGTVELDFEQWAGGTVDSEDTKHRSAITRRQTARGGLKARDNVTLRRECDAAAWAVIPQLEDSSGIDRATAVRQMVGPRGEVIGKPTTVTGILKSVKYPDYNLSGNDVGLLEVEVGTDENRG